MLNTDALSTNPFLLPAPWLKGIDRLRVLAGDTTRSRSAETLTADEAIARLTEVGLTCGAAKGPRLHLLGGTSVLVECGISVYQRPFTILEEQAGGFLAGVAGVRPFHDEEVHVATLAQAVEAVLRIYRARGMLPPVEVRR